MLEQESFERLQKVRALEAEVQNLRKQLESGGGGGGEDSESSQSKDGKDDKALSRAKSKIKKLEKENKALREEKVSFAFLVLCCAFSLRLFAEHQFLLVLNA